MKPIVDCIEFLEEIIEEFDLTDEEKETLSDAIEYLSVYEDLRNS